MNTIRKLLLLKKQAETIRDVLGYDNSILPSNPKKRVKSKSFISEISKTYPSIMETYKSTFDDKKSDRDYANQFNKDLIDYALQPPPKKEYENHFYVTVGNKEYSTNQKETFHKWNPRFNSSNIKILENMIKKFEGYDTTKWPQDSKDAYDRHLYEYKHDLKRLKYQAPQDPVEKKMDSNYYSNYSPTRALDYGLAESIQGKPTNTRGYGLSASIKDTPIDIGRV